MRIYLVLLLYVGAVLCCKPEGAVIKLHVHCERAACRDGKWVPEECTHDDDQYQSASATGEEVIFKCDEGKRYTDFSDSSLYYECSNGIVVPRRCPPGNRFDGYMRECVRKHVSDEEPGSECQGNRLYPDNFGISMYLKCTNGELVTQFCPNGTVFDSKKIACFPTSAPPDQNVNGVISKRVRCNHGETRKKEGSCKQYYECNHGTEVIAKCMQCQNYDENESKCRYVFDFPCHSKFPEQSTTTSSEFYSTTVPRKWTSEKSPLITTESVTENIGRSTTANGGGSSSNTTAAIVPETKTSDSSEPGSTPIPLGNCKSRRGLPDCKYFLECEEGELVTRRCGWLQYFDSLTNTCSFMGYTCYGTE
ncbi:uncharacterized protein [Halyomorpha halys]|uniref:uncharacterized protein n=1 Tax=Halyomorpha halys TaxID=286706 RepID=UPI0006D510BE|nr:uncharacterized protein LOC106678263 [Halyomorpha halys]